MSPDIFSFGIYMAARILGISQDVDFSKGHMDQSLVPYYVHGLYNITHSLIIAGLVFFLVWLFLKKFYWPLAAWPLHIIVDIPSHSANFFPTPFLWPISDFTFNGIGWGNPIIFFPNIIIIILLYIIFFYKKRKDKNFKSFKK